MYLVRTLPRLLVLFCACLATSAVHAESTRLDLGQMFTSLFGKTESPPAQAEGEPAGANSAAPVAAEGNGAGGSSFSPIALYQAHQEKMRDGYQKYLAMMAEAKAITPPTVREGYPATLSRSMYGKAHASPDYVVYNCNFVLNPDNTTCEAKGKAAAVALLKESHDWEKRLTPDFLNKVYDPELERLGLASHFPNGGGATRPAVRVFDAGADGINFWFNERWATQEQAAAAALEHCARQGRAARLAAASQGCGAPGAVDETASNNYLGGLVKVKSSTRQARDKRQTYVMLGYDCLH